MTQYVIFDPNMVIASGPYSSRDDAKAALKAFFQASDPSMTDDDFAHNDYWMEDYYIAPLISSLGEAERARLDDQIQRLEEQKNRLIYNN